MAIQVVDWYNQNRASKNVPKMEKNPKKLKEDSKKLKEDMVSQDDKASKKHEAQHQDVAANDDKHIEVQKDENVLEEDKTTKEGETTKGEKTAKKGKAPMFEQKEKIPSKAKRIQHEEMKEERTKKVGEGRRVGVKVNVSKENAKRKTEKVTRDSKVPKESNQVIKSAKAKEGAGTEIVIQPNTEKYNQT